MTDQNAYMRVYMREWRKENREKCRAADRRYQERKRNTLKALGLYRKQGRPKAT